MKVGDLVIFKKPPVRNTPNGLAQENKYDTVGIIVKVDHPCVHVSWNFLNSGVGRNFISDIEVIKPEEELKWQT